MAARSANLPTTITRITATIIAYSAIAYSAKSWPASSDHESPTTRVIELRFLVCRVLAAEAPGRVSGHPKNACYFLKQSREAITNGNEQLVTKRTTPKAAESSSQLGREGVKRLLRRRGRHLHRLLTLLLLLLLLNLLLALQFLQ